MKYGNVIGAVHDRPLALMPSKLRTIVDLLTQKAAGVNFSPEEIQARIGTPSAAAPLAAAKQVVSRGSQGAIAVLPLYGVIAQRMNMMMQASGGTSTQMFGAALQDALNDDTVKAIVIDIDSPGGDVFGVQELAQMIYEARDIKPIVAIANSLAASAAYWLGAQASEFVVTPGGMVGSVGVYCVHFDYSKANEIEGITPTYISAGKYKIEGNPDEPLTEDAVAFIQGQVNEYYSAFTADVARGRGVPVDVVVSNFAEGRVLTAKPAKAAGMVDRVQTFDQVVARLGASSGKEVRQSEPMPMQMPAGQAQSSAAAATEDKPIAEDALEEAAISETDAPTPEIQERMKRFADIAFAR